jgi:hypothetical protein
MTLAVNSGRDLSTHSVAQQTLVAGELATDILCAFGKADWGSTNIFPALLRLHLEKPLSMHGPLWNALVSFSMSRRLSGSPAEVYARE